MSTPDIDIEALDEAMREVRDERFQRDVKEWMIHAAPPEVAEIWARYVKKMEERQEREAASLEQARAKYIEMMWWFKVISWVFAMGVAIYLGSNIYELASMEFGGCAR